jgi:hypothetical protein
MSRLWVQVSRLVVTRAVAEVSGVGMIWLLDTSGGSARVYTSRFRALRALMDFLF